MASQIDPTQPADGVPADKADLRTNLQHAKGEIETLQADVAALQGAAGAAGAVIHAEDFGAVPDGVHDDNAAAINAAIQAASDYSVAGQRIGGRVQLLRGIYRINETILLRSLSELAGLTPTASTIEVESGANCRAVATIDGNQRAYGIRDLGVYGNASGQAADDGTPAGDRGGIYLLNDKAAPSGIGWFRFGPSKAWAYNLLIQEVAGNGFMVTGNGDQLCYNVQVRWTKRYGHYIDINDGSVGHLQASRTGWAGFFCDGASGRFHDIKVWFNGVELDAWELARDWAQANDTGDYNRQFDDPRKAGCGVLIRGARNSFSQIECQDTAGIGLYLQAPYSHITDFKGDQLGQVNAGGSTTGYPKWLELNGSNPFSGVYIRNGSEKSKVDVIVYDLKYKSDGTPGGATEHDVLEHLVENHQADEIDLIVTGQVEIPERLSGQPVISKAPYRLHGAQLPANL